MRSSRADAADSLREESARTAAAVSAEVQRYEDAVGSVAAAIGAQKELHSDEYATLTQPLVTARLDGASGIVYVVPARSDAVTAVQATWRGRGNATLTLDPEPDATLVGDAQHRFIVLGRPLDGGTTTYGRDLQAVAPAEALMAARRTGRVTISAPYVLLKDRELPVASQQLSFVMVAPVNDPASGSLRGWVLMGLRGGDLLDAVLASSTDGRANAVLTATHEDGRPVVVARSRTGDSSDDADMTRSTLVDVAQQQWSLDFAATRAAAAGDGARTRLLGAVVGAGAALTALLAVIVYLLLSARARAELAVQRATAALVEAEADARRQSGLLAAVLNSISDGVGVVDQSGTFLLHNPAAKVLLGVASDIGDVDQWQEHYGIFELDGVTPFPLDQLPLMRALDGESSDHVEMLIRNAALPDGRPITVSARPLDPEAGVPGAVAVFHDLTPRLEAQAQLHDIETQRRAVLDTASDAYIAMDSGGVITDWNPAATALLGWPAEQAVGQRLSELIVPVESRAAHEAGLRRFLATERVVLEGAVALRAVRRDGSLVSLDLSLSRTRSGSTWLFHALMRDATERLRHEAELQRSESMFRSAFDDALVGMCLTSLDGRFMRVNAVFAAMLGRGTEELLGTSFSDITHPEDRDVSVADVRRVLAGEIEGFRASKRYVRADGGVTYADLSTSLARGADGSPLHFVTQTVDVTDRHVVEVERDTHLGMLRSVIANSQSLVYVKDLEGRYLLANAPFEQAFGVTEAELLGNDDTFLDPDLAPVWRVNDLRAQQGEYRVEEWSDGPEGRCYYESVKLPLHDGAGVLYATCGISLDVTQSRRAAVAMIEARDAALEATATKSAFLATMSHEIRTPMNAVIGMTGLLLDTDLDTEQRQFLETVRASGDALLAIINDILDFSRIEAGELILEMRPFDLRDCVEESVSLVAASTVDVDVVVYVADDCPRAVVGDSNRLRQVLVNLVGNAVKFTDRGHVFVAVSSEDDGLSFSVQDTGIGIPAERMERLFKSFSQVDASTTRVYGGSGLGLAISQAIVSAMDGSIRVISEPDVGSTFSFTVDLPACDTTDLPQTAEGDAATDLQGRRALVVDDNGTNRRILRLQLEGWGLECVDVAVPAAALALLEAGATFDVAILDMHMPGMDGAALGEHIHAMPAHAAMPLVLLTSLGTRPQTDDPELFAAFHPKPVRAGRLRSLLADLLGAHPAPQSPQSPAERPATVRPVVALSVLLAEDNEVNRTVGRAMLQKLGHEVDTVTNGREALEAVRRGAYDVVLMDLHMPVMDGLAASRAIRSLPGHGVGRAPRILAMTASALDTDREASSRAGMQGYLLKPVRIEELASALDQGRPAEPAPPRKTATEAAPVDWAVLDELAEQMGTTDSGVRTALVEDYLNQGRRWVADLLAAAQTGDGAGVRQASHALQSSSALLGATELARLLHDAGRAAHVADNPLGPPAAAVAAEFGRVTQAFHALLADAAPSVRGSNA